MPNHKHTVGERSGINKLEVTRISDERLELKINKEKVIILTEDLAALVRMELPADRAEQMFSEIDEQAITRGKMRVRVRAQHDIKRGEDVVFSVDVTKYIDKYGQPTGIRGTKSGFIF